MTQQARISLAEARSMNHREREYFIEMAKYVREMAVWQRENQT